MNVRADVFISLRFSEARDKAVLLGDALRKRGINTTWSDPTARWDRHEMPTKQVSNTISFCDLVVVIASPLYGKQIRGHFGSFEELALIKKLKKPYFLIKATNTINLPSVRDLELRQPGFFSWFLGEPGEPPLPGGLVDDVHAMLDEVRGLDEEDPSEDGEQVSAALLYFFWSLATVCALASSQRGSRRLAAAATACSWL